MALGEFEHGRYGDLSGVCFYGQTAGRRLNDDRLAVSDSFIHPLFCGILERAARQPGGVVPRLVVDWNLIQGWTDVSGPVAVMPEDARELAIALAALVASDVEPWCAGATSEQCLRCAREIIAFLETRLAAHVSLYIEDD